MQHSLCCLRLWTTRTWQREDNPAGGSLSMSGFLAHQACLHSQILEKVLLAPRTAAEGWNQGGSHPGR